MTSKEFEQLSKYEQIHIIKDHGVFLADKVVLGNRLFLYAINTFYVELILELSNMQSTGLVLHRIVDDITDLHSYQEKVLVTAEICNWN